MAGIRANGSDPCVGSRCERGPDKPRAITGCARASRAVPRTGSVDLTAKLCGLRRGRTSTFVSCSSAALVEFTGTSRGSMAVPVIESFPLLGKQEAKAEPVGWRGAGGCQPVNPTSKNSGDQICTIPTNSRCEGLPEDRPSQTRPCSSQVRSEMSARGRMRYAAVERVQEWVVDAEDRAGAMFHRKLVGAAGCTALAICCVARGTLSSWCCVSDHATTRAVN